MSLKDKAAKINFDEEDDGEGSTSGALVATTTTAAPPPLPRRSGVATITQSIATQHRIQDLESELATFKDGKSVVKLDPKRIRQSRWKNRHELSFKTQQYLDLKAEIEAAGENVQPIKVRVIGCGPDGKDEYEIVYGRRRLRACLELGLLVNAIIVISMTEEELFSEMERENRGREDLTPWEQGVMYKDALDGGLYSSQRQLSAKLGVNLGLVSTAIKLASLPDEIVAAFSSPLDLQFRWAQLLSEALDKGAVRVMVVAEEIAQLSEKPPAKQVLARLVAAGADSEGEGAAAQPKEFRVGGKVVGSLARDRRGGIAFKVRGGVLQPAAEKKLVEFIERFFDK